MVATSKTITRNTVHVYSVMFLLLMLKKNTYMYVLTAWRIDEVGKEGGMERDSFCIFCISDAFCSVKGMHFSVKWTYFLYK